MLVDVCGCAGGHGVDRVTWEELCAVRVRLWLEGTSGVVDIMPCCNMAWYSEDVCTWACACLVSCHCDCLPVHNVAGAVYRSTRADPSDL